MLMSLVCGLLNVPLKNNSFFVIMHNLELYMITQITDQKTFLIITSERLTKYLQVIRNISLPKNNESMFNVKTELRALQSIHKVRRSQSGDNNCLISENPRVVQILLMLRKKGLSYVLTKLMPRERAILCPIPMPLCCDKNIFKSNKFLADFPITIKCIFFTSWDV